MLVQLWVNPSLTSGVRAGGEGKAARTASHPKAAVSTARANAVASAPVFGRRVLSPQALRNGRSRDSV